MLPRKRDCVIAALYRLALLAIVLIIVGALGYLGGWAYEKESRNREAYLNQQPQ